MNSSSFNIHL